jgi:hypothetical protein
VSLIALSMRRADSLHAFVVISPRQRISLSRVLLALAGFKSLITSNSMSVPAGFRGLSFHGLLFNLFFIYDRDF